MVRRPIRPERTKSTDRTFDWHSFLPWIGGGGIVVTVLIFIIFLAPPAINPETFCPRDGNLGGTSVLLIDISDKLSDAQEARLENELKNISSISAERKSPFLSKGQRLVVYMLNEEYLKPEQIFDMCHPGDLENRSVVEKLSQGEIFARKNWIKFHSEVLGSIKSNIAKKEEMGTSPIIETIKFLREKEFDPPGILSSQTENRFIIWSDMLQNSREVSHFLDLSDVRDTFKQNKVDMRYVETIIFHIISTKYSEHQTNEQVAWWRKFFALARADLDWKVL